MTYTTVVRRRRRKRCIHCGLASMRPCENEMSQSICSHYAAVLVEQRKVADANREVQADSSPRTPAARV